MGGSARLKLLLDTHIWLWSVSEPRRLSRGVSAHLKDPQSEIWLSPISTYEALTLNFKGRYRIEGDIDEWLSQAVAGTHEAPLTHEIALVARGLQMHQDPVDRMLAATAQVLDMTLVTADRSLLG